MSDAAPPGGDEPAGGAAPSGGPEHAGNPTAETGFAGRTLLAAITLLTILPVPAGAQREIGAREVAASAPWFPVVGAVLGLLIGLAGHAAEGSSVLVAGALVAVLLAVVTGALHLDGLADSADALGARGGSRERRLEIMRDPSTGAYGTVAIVGWFGLVAAGAAGPHYGTFPSTLALVLALSRASAVAHAAQVEPARAGGLGAGFSPSGRALGLTALSTVGVIAVLVALSLTGAAALALPGAGQLVAVLVSVLVVRLLVDGAARKLVGGRTGDTLGAVIALTEAVALTSAVLAT